MAFLCLGLCTLRCPVTPGRLQRFALAKIFTANIWRPRVLSHRFDYPLWPRLLPAQCPAGNDRRSSAFHGARCGSYWVQWRFAMPVLLGFILGVAVTILGVYEYDSTTGRAGNGLAPTAAGGKAPMVNWDVVSEDWHNFQSGVRSTTDDIERNLKQHSG